MPKKPHYIYGLFDPITDVCRYIGTSYDPRARFDVHKVLPHNRRLRVWIQDLKANGHDPYVEVLGQGHFAEEKKWLQIYQASIYNVQHCDPRPNEDYVYLYSLCSKDLFDRIQRTRGDERLSEFINRAVTAACVGH